MASNAVIYARTSPDCTVSAEAQVASLKAVAADHGWTVVDVFVDHQATAKKDRRPAEMALLEAIRSRDSVERVLLWSIDRVGRTLVDLVGFIETCRTNGIGLYLHEQGIDTATSYGMSLFELAGMMAYHLRQSRRDKILRGQAAVRGIVRFGRPPMPTIKIEKAKKALIAGKGVRETARLSGISAASVTRLKSELNQNAA
jgi:DNA invertase Pin-like site-specific DNA recombinase